VDHARANQHSYSDARVIAHYTRRDGLFEAEAELLRDCPPFRQLDVLDLGIGGGRTTRVVAPLARRYVGIDYIPAMVSAAAATTNHLWDLRTGDATDLSDFTNEEFDLVFFSFNGLATLPSPESRRRCLAEVRRVTRPGGHFLFSLGNARFLKTPPADSRSLRLRFRSALGYGRQLHRLAEPAFWRGQGWRTEVVLDGTTLHTYAALPKFVQAELSDAGLRLDRTLNGLFPRDVRRHQTPWWYYLASRP
jgi:SAM-dependent methyltransferase